MAYGYLKEPVDQHKNIKIPLKVLFVKGSKAMVHSNLSDKTFEIDAELLCFKSNEPILEYSEYIVDTPKKKIIGTAGPIIDLFEANLTQEEWNALCTVHRLRLRLNLGIRFDWSKSIDVRNEETSQIVDESVFLKKETK